MFKKISLLGALVALAALSAIACQAIPNLVPQPTPTVVPTVAPTTAPASQALAKPQTAGKRIEGALGLADLSGGIVSENKNGALTVRLQGKQTKQIQTNPSTIVVIPGKSNAQVVDIHVGDRVIADYGADATNTTAALLLDLPSDYTAGNVLLGAVTTTKSGTINVRTRTGNDKIGTTNQTTFVNLSGDKPALSVFKDLKQGNVVIAIGQDGTDTFDAQVIVVTDSDARALLNRNQKNAPAPTPTPKPGT